jgi:hexokinase
MLRTLHASHKFKLETEAELALPSTVVSYTGSVIERYPGYLTTCQQYVDGLVEALGGTPGSLDLIAANESTIIGAAVALACAQEGIAN